MKIDLTAAMRRAAARVRDRDVMGATRIIQEALGLRGATPGEPASRREPAPRPPEPEREPAVPRRPRLDPDAEVVEPLEDRADTPPPGPGPAPGWVRPRMRLPLGDALRLLREGRAAFGLAPGLRRTVPPPEVPEGARYETRRFACAAGARDYRLYVPARTGALRGLVVMLHGCKQTADDFATGTGMNALAEREGLVVVYPWQRKEHNGLCCWNWFNPGDQRRDAGEPAIIAGITREVAAEFGLEHAMVAGLSAGGAMAAVMATTYPELYDAAGVHSGLAYGSANDVASAFAAMRGDQMGEPGGAPDCRMIVFHGDADGTVHPDNAARIVAAAGPGVVWREAGESRGRSYARTIIRDGRGRARVEFWMVEGQGHAWSGGQAPGSYVDPDGPDASAEMVRFFLEAR